MDEHKQADRIAQVRLALVKPRGGGPSVVAVHPVVHGVAARQRPSGAGIDEFVRRAFEEERSLRVLAEETMHEQVDVGFAPGHVARGARTFARHAP
jgi:hypothetical protein